MNSTPGPPIAPGTIELAGGPKLSRSEARRLKEEEHLCKVVGRVWVKQESRMIWMVLLVFCKGTVELLIWQILVKSERSRRKQPKLDHLPKHGGAESCGQYLTFPKRYAPWFSSPFCSSKAFCRVVLRYTKKSASTLHETNYDIMMNHEHPFSAHKSTRIGGQAKVKGRSTAGHTRR